MNRVVLLLMPGLCCAQQAGMPTFGTTVYISAGLTGEVFLIKPGSQTLPRFQDLESAGKIYTTALNVWPREFTQGFPGVLGHFEWFAIDYTGKFWIQKPGKYRFKLTSADGSKLYIDGRQVINHDGHHPPTSVEGSATLHGGVHRMRVSYFQGPRFHVALILEVAGAGEGWRLFSTDEFRPPHSD